MNAKTHLLSIPRTASPREASQNGIEDRQVFMLSNPSAFVHGAWHWKLWIQGRWWVSSAQNPAGIEERKLTFVQHVLRR